MDVKPTRMELLVTRRKLKIASKGHRLLKQKMDVMVLEFFNILKEVKKIRIDVATKLEQAKFSLNIAQGIEGEPAIERLSSSLSSGAEITFSEKNIMGIKLPIIDNINVQHEGYGLCSYSIELDDTILKYQELLPLVLKLVEKQLALNKLGEEIKKTKRRVNSLEYLTIPFLEDIKKLITFKLEEMERENIGRLKKIKSKNS